MDMDMIIYLGLFVIGFIEEFIAIIYYGFVRKGWKMPCSIFSMLRNVIWILAGAGVFASFLNFEVTFGERFSESIIRGAVHTVGVGIGNYLSLMAEPFIHTKILKLQNKGRRKRRWYLLLERK